MARFPVRDDDRRPWRYRFIAGVFRVIFGVYWFRRIHLHGFENIPTGTPLLVASNHLSNLDALLYGAYFPRTMYAMAKKELFKGPLVSWFLRGCNTFPVDRGGADRGALKMANDLLKDRGRLLIFVEGTRARTPGMKRAESGAGFLQRRSGVPVLPVALWGSEAALGKGGKLPRRAHMHMRVGQVMHIPAAAGRGDDQATSDRIAENIAALLPPEYRGAYATPVAEVPPAV